MTAPAPTPSVAGELEAGGYIPGVCNIGRWEIRKRWIGGIVGLVIAALVLAVLIALQAPPIARVLVLPPAWGGVFSVLQARRRFCGAYALRRISNFGAGRATIRAVEGAAAHRADLAALGRLARDSLAVAFVVTAVAVALPV